MVNFTGPALKPSPDWRLIPKRFTFSPAWLALGTFMCILIGCMAVGQSFYTGWDSGVVAVLLICLLLSGLFQLLAWDEIQRLKQTAQAAQENLTTVLRAVETK